MIPCATVIVESKKNAQKEKICKPSELPIYTPDKPTVSQQEPECFPEPGAIENTFATIRRTIFTFTTEVNAYQRVATEYVEKGIDNADCKLDQLLLNIYNLGFHFLCFLTPNSFKVSCKFLYHFGIIYVLEL